MVLSEPQLAQNGGCSNCQRPVNSMTEKTKSFSNQRKIQILTLVTEDWAI